jgi:uncharacterized protein DUF3800
MVSCEQYSPVLGMAHAAYPGGIDGKHLFMFTAYLDDSGTHKGSINVTVGGFVASVEQWKAFEDDWSWLLEEYDLAVDPGYFHMTDYNARQGPYVGWGDDKRIEFMRSLTSIIRKRVSAGIAASLPAHNYAKVKAALPEAFSAYTTCAHICWKHLGQWAEENGYESAIACEFEEGTQGGGEILASHRDLLLNHPKTSEQYHLGGIGFHTKKRMLPLQAADFFAYETYRRMNETFMDIKCWRKSIEAIVSSVPVYATFMNDEGADAAVRGILGHLGSSPPTGV